QPSLDHRLSLDHRPSLDRPGSDDHRDVTGVNGRGPVPVLEFRDVWFGYDPGRTVLRGVSLQVPARGHTALIGRSGAGKSSVFALAVRFYDPDRGQILLHGHDVRATGRSEHRARIGLVEQDCPVLHGTLRDNLTYAAPDAGDGDIQRAIEYANLGEL